MPWHQKAKKDVIPAISFGELDKKLRAGDVRMGEPDESHISLSWSQSIGSGGETR